MRAIRQEKQRIPGGSPRIRAFACLLWLSLTMLPCSLLALDGPVCPGCPESPAIDSGLHQGHGGHEMSEDSHGDCGADDLDCCDIDPLRPAERGHNPGGDSHQPAPAATAYPLVSLPYRVAAEEHATGPPADRLVGSSRLHAIYCVYLD